MAKVKKPHHRGTFHVDSMKVRQAAWADPLTRCWRCGKTLYTCGPRGDGRHKNGKPARWTAGHLVDGQVGGSLLPECSPCASTSGNALKKARRAAQTSLRAPQHTSRRW